MHHETLKYRFHPIYIQSVHKYIQIKFKDRPKLVTDILIISSEFTLDRSNGCKNYYHKLH